ncbi:MAG TPA: hypothetical protein VM346_11445 [Sphingomicrobium sp.]|nr:hypothetical protein [Sphingomicrobium sp.]
MIELLMAAALYSSQGSMAAVNASRDAFSKCLRDAAQQAKTSSIKADAFPEFALQQCAAAGSRFKSALVTLDVANKVPRKQAEEDAQVQIDDYVAGSAESYQMMLNRGT